MKIFSLFLIFCATFVPNVRAQNANVSGVTVELTTEQDQFLSNEEMRLGVRITNRSGQTLNFGKGNDWLTFTIQARDNYVVSQLGNVPVAGEFSLDSSFAGTKRVNLTPYFDFRQPGRYEVTATVKLPQWNKEVTSAPKVFDIINGTTLREFSFGVPQANTNAQPEMRKYVLQQAIYLKKMKLYVRLTDATGSSVFKVFPIAPLVSFSEPEAQLDRFSNLHVLSQVGARSFSYSVINPDGEVIVRQLHDYTQTRPILRADADGKISVVGGIRHVASTDLPKFSNKQLPVKNAQTHQP